MSQSDVAARAAKLSDRRRDRPGQPAADTQGSQAAAAAPRAKPVRVTTDLAPQSYRALVGYCSELAETLGRAKVPHVEVMRALVARLDVDPQLREAIAQSVQEQLSS